MPLKIKDIPERDSCSSHRAYRIFNYSVLICTAVGVIAVVLTKRFCPSFAASYGQAALLGAVSGYVVGAAVGYGLAFLIVGTAPNPFESVD